MKTKIPALFLVAAIACGIVGCKEKVVTPDDGYTTDHYIPTIEDINSLILEDDRSHETKKVDWAGPYDYVRMSITDKDGKKAWTNPIFL